MPGTLGTLETLGTVGMPYNISTMVISGKLLLL